MTHIPPPNLESKQLIAKIFRNKDLEKSLRHLTFSNLTPRSSGDFVGTRKVCAFYILSKGCASQLGPKWLWKTRNRRFIHVGALGRAEGLRGDRADTARRARCAVGSGILCGYLCQPWFAGPRPQKASHVPLVSCHPRRPS